MEKIHFFLSGYSDFLQRFMSFKKSGEATIKTESEQFSMKFIGLNRGVLCLELLYKWGRNADRYCR